MQHVTADVLKQCRLTFALYQYLLMVPQDVQSPCHSLHDTVMCELDVASFTSGRQAEEAGVPAEHRGKYLGLLDRLDHIQ